MFNRLDGWDCGVWKEGDGPLVKKITKPSCPLSTPAIALRLVAEHNPACL